MVAHARTTNASFRLTARVCRCYKNARDNRFCPSAALLPEAFRSLTRCLLTFAHPQWKPGHAATFSAHAAIAETSPAADSEEERQLMMQRVAELGDEAERVRRAGGWHVERAEGCDSELQHFVAAHNHFWKHTFDSVLVVEEVS